MMFNTKWQLRFLQLAQHISGWSKDPSTKCGAVIVRPDKTVASTGYNGFPRLLRDHATRLEDRDQKYSMTVHSEMNAILHSKESLRGYAIFCFPFLPCDRCAVHIIQAGITEVYSYRIDEEKEQRWGVSLARTRQYFREAKIICEEV